MMQEIGINVADNLVLPKFVDLGLPSGKLWATENVGANSSYDVGFRFKNEDIQDLLNPYNGIFSLPTQKDIEELLEYTDMQWNKFTHSTDNGYIEEEGLRILSMENGRQLYFPSCCWDNHIVHDGNCLPYGFYQGNDVGEISFYKNGRTPSLGWNKAYENIPLPVRLVSNM